MDATPATAPQSAQEALELALQAADAIPLTYLEDEPGRPYRYVRTDDVLEALSAAGWRLVPAEVAEAGEAVAAPGKAISGDLWWYEVHADFDDGTRFEVSIGGSGRLPGAGGTR